jgi:hypothetical protein
VFLASAVIGVNEWWSSDFGVRSFLITWVAERPAVGSGSLTLLHQGKKVEIFEPICYEIHSQGMKKCHFS